MTEDSFNSINTSGNEVPSSITGRKDVKNEEEMEDQNLNKNQQLSRWQSLQKNINNNLEQLNKENIKETIFSLFKLNLIRGRGLFVEYIIKIQCQKVEMTDVYSSIVNIINSKIPKIGELLINRLVLYYKTTLALNDGHLCEITLNFLSQLIIFNVCGCMLAFDIIDELLNNVNDLRIGLITEIFSVAGKHLFNEDNILVDKVYDRLRNVLSEGIVKRKGQLLIQKCFQLRKLEFENINDICEELDLVEEDDIITHDVRLKDDPDAHDELNNFQFDSNYIENEKIYDALKKEILGDDSIDDSEAENSDYNSDNNLHGASSDFEEQAPATIKDLTERDLLDYQKRIYLTIMSSMGPEEATHKLLKVPSVDNKRKEYLLVDMIIKCCAQEKTYSKYYGSIGEILVVINDNWRAAFDQVFRETYDNSSKFETTLLRNIGKFWGHMFASDKMGLEVLSNVKLTEEDTSSSGRIFLKFLFQRMLEELGASFLIQRLNEDYIQDYLKGIFPHDDPEHLRFSINFFTAIGLGKLTDRMRDSLISTASNFANIETRGRKRLASDKSPRSGSSSRSRSTSNSSSRSSSNRRDSSYSRSPSRKRNSYDNTSKERPSAPLSDPERYRNNHSSRGRLPTGPRSRYNNGSGRSQNRYRRGYSGRGRRVNYTDRERS